MQQKETHLHRRAISRLISFAFFILILCIPRIRSDASPNPLPVAQTQTILQFYDQVCSGEWYGGFDGAPFPTWPKRLPCPGAAGHADGFVQRLNSNDKLENGSNGSLAIETYPTMQQNGFIRGTFSLARLSVMLQDGDRFIAQVGFAQGMTSARSRFMVIYDPDPVESGNEQQLADVTKSYNGNLHALNIDLSQFAGQQGDIILRVETAGPPTQDRAVWVNARIERQQPPTPVTPPTPTHTNTPPPPITAFPTAKATTPPPISDSPTPTRTKPASVKCSGTTLFLKANPVQPNPNQLVTFSAAAAPGCPLERLELWVNHELIKACAGPKCQQDAGPFPEGIHLFDAFGFDGLGNIVYPGTVVIEGETIATSFDHIGEPIQTCPLCPELAGGRECTAQICTGDEDADYYAAGGAQIECQYEGLIEYAVEFDFPAATVLFGEDSSGPYDDTCLSEATLAEFFCQGTGGLRELHYDCPVGCSDGACIPCLDSDGGFNIEEEGEIINDPQGRADYCNSNTEQVEYYCVGNQVRDHAVRCFSCASGTCLECVDSDGGYNPFEAGTTSNGHQDQCVPSGPYLFEWTSDVENGVCVNRQIEIYCPTGCAQGACNPSCMDGVQNGDEQGVDCGGSCPASCVNCWNPLSESDIFFSGTSPFDGNSFPLDDSPDSVAQQAIEAAFGSYFSFADPVVQQTAYDALAEYADCLRDYYCRNRLDSFIQVPDYAAVRVTDLIGNTDAIMEAVAFYVSEHMGYVGDDDRGQAPKVQSASWTINESGNAGCAANKTIYSTPLVADYCGDCEDFAILRNTLMRILGVSADCAYCADQFNNRKGQGGHTFNLVYYRNRWRIMDYWEMGKYSLYPPDPHRPGNIWNDNYGEYWCYPYKDDLLQCDLRSPGDHTWNYHGGDLCPAPNVLIYWFVPYDVRTLYVDTCP